jgi:hypothetical protein
MNAFLGKFWINRYIRRMLLRWKFWWQALAEEAINNRSCLKELENVSQCEKYKHYTPAYNHVRKLLLHGARLEYNPRLDRGPYRVATSQYITDPDYPFQILPVDHLLLTACELEDIALAHYLITYKKNNMSVVNRRLAHLHAASFSPKINQLLNDSTNEPKYIMEMDPNPYIPPSVGMRYLKGYWQSFKQ